MFIKMVRSSRESNSYQVTSPGVSLYLTCSRMAVFSSMVMMSYRCVGPSRCRDGEWILSRRVMLDLQQRFTHVFIHVCTNICTHSFTMNCHHFITSQAELGSEIHLYIFTSFKTIMALKIYIWLAAVCVLK